MYRKIKQAQLPLLLLLLLLQLLLQLLLLLTPSVWDIAADPAPAWCPQTAAASGKWGQKYHKVLAP